MPSHDIVPMGNLPWQPAPSVQTLAPPVTAANLLHSLRRRWWIGAALGLLGAIGAAMLAWNLVPSHQTVSSTLQVNRIEEVTIGGTQRPSTPEQVTAFKLTQAGLIKQRLNLASALNTKDPDTGFDLWKNAEVRRHADPLGWLEQELTVDFFQGSDLMLVSLRGEDPKELAKIVNAVVDTYLEESKKASDARLAKVRRDLDQRIESRQQKLTSTMNKLAQMAKTLGVADSSSLAASHAANQSHLSALRQQVSELQRQHRSTTMQIWEARIERDSLATRQPTEFEIENALKNDPHYQEKLKKLNELRQYVNRIAGTVRDPSSNKIKHWLNQVQALEQEVADYRDEMRPVIESTFSDPHRVESLTERLAELETMKLQLEKNLEDVNNDLNQLFGRLTDIGRNTTELDILQNDKLNHQADLNTLHVARRELDMQESQPPRVQQLVRANLPESTSQALRYMAVAFAAAFGFGLPIVGITFWDFQQHRVNHPNDASTALGTKILGALPPVAGRKSRKALDPSKAGSLGWLQRSLADSVDGVRTALLRDTATEGTRVVLVTSAVHYEGKTTLATQLATSLARAGKRTLLVDGDLRKPVAHRLYGLSLEPGLCEVLRNECELEETLRPTRASGLWMMTAGRCDEESLHELAKESSDEIFKQLRSTFDYIIIDSSPVLASADALVIGQYVDAAILSVLRDNSRVPSVYEAYDRLRGVDIRVMGTVFNGSKQNVRPVSSGKKQMPAKAAAL